LLWSVVKAVTADTPGMAGTGAVAYNVADMEAKHLRIILRIAC
jgi:hypothetical protein